QMKNKISLSVITCFLFLFGAQAQQNALNKWQKGIVKDEFIYDKAAFPSCHSASIAETTTGNLVYTFFGGTRERHPDVEIYICRYDSGGWSAPSAVADGVQEDGSRLATWNPVLYQIRHGGLWLFYKVGAKPSEWWCMLKRCTVGPKTWSAAERLPDGDL